MEVRRSLGSNHGNNDVAMQETQGHDLPSTVTAPRERDDRLGVNEANVAIYHEREQSSDK